MRIKVGIFLFATLWSVGAGVVLAQSHVTTRVSGTAQAVVTAGYATAAPCDIEADKLVLAVGQDPSSGDIALFTAGDGCEGMVWITSDQLDDFAWDDPDGLATLTEISRPAPPTRQPPLSRLSDFEDLCANATFASNWPNNAPLIFAGSYNSRFDAGLLATTTAELNVIVCVSDQESVLNNCPYTGGFTLTRQRPDKVAKLVNYETGGYIAVQTFYGTAPDPCPYQIRVSVGATHYIWTGEPPADETWIEWVSQRLNNRSGIPATARTTVNSATVNCRAEANTDSEILTQVSYGTPVNLIARNEAGDWVVALLPDMSQAWLFADLLSLAAQTDIDLLPVADGPAADVPITLPQE